MVACQSHALAGDWAARPVPDAFAGTIKITADHIGGIAQVAGKAEAIRVGRG